ncbi:MAG: acyl-CoA dehydrogenase family protein, partial [Fimbriimonadaceae bacterium]|nr:acyl-CoA dehydrogenase family protein [Fimbriimonadaceae bacterium]
NLKTRGTRTSDGFSLSGTKMWISNAKWAGLFTVLARTDEGPTAFLVERDRPGVSVSREEHKMGLKGSSTARLILEDVEVPAGSVLHQEGKGHHAALNALNLGRFKLGAMSLGPTRPAIEAALDYAQARRQFGRPIAEFGLIRRKAALMAAWRFAAESALYRLGAEIDAAFEAAGSSTEARVAAARVLAPECALVKVLTTEAEARIIDEALQIFGGYGFSEEFPLARLYRDARVSRIYEGTNEMNRLLVGNGLRPPGDILEDSLPARLAAPLIARSSRDQVQTAALADLLILAYAGQSARLRARQTGDQLQAQLSRIWDAWAESEAIRAATEAGWEVAETLRPMPDLEEIGSEIFRSGPGF